MFSLQSYTDQALLQMLNEGSNTAFEQIYLRYWKDCYNAAYKVLQDDAACMDVMQDVFVWLWENKQKVQPNNLKAYLLTAVKFKMLNVIRHNKINKAAIEHFKNSGASCSFIENSVELKELKLMLNQFIESLPPRAAQIFNLSRNGQLSNKEIAQRMHLSEKTVKNQIHISLKKLKSALGNLSCWAVFFM
ncbi:RNA polymerase sigma-70 factor [Arachidicoccus ginsenosidivorans]|jgi:RNA polymerase sigma-70 factor (ECF subfamily)